MRRRVFALFLVLLCSLSLIYADEKMSVSFEKISAKLPAGWLAQSISESTMKLIFYSPDELNDRFRERITITGGERMGDVTTAAEIQNLKNSFMSYYDDCNVVSEGWSHILIDGRLNGLHVQQYIKFVMKKEAAYCITATALPETYANWEPVFMEIIDSITIKN